MREAVRQCKAVTHSSSHQIHIVSMRLSVHLIMRLSVHLVMRLSVHLVLPNAPVPL